MIKSKTHQYKNRLFKDEEGLFFVKLEDCATAVRHCAHEIVAFLDALPHQTPELVALKEAYAQFELLPIQDFPKGLETIETDFLKVPLVEDKTHYAAMNDAEFLSYFEKQNQFNEKTNKLVRKAIEIEGWV